MRKLFLFTFFIFGISSALFAQDGPPPMGGRLEALKIGFLTRRLELTPEEAEKFWPIYNKYTEDLRKTHKENLQSGMNELDREDKILQLRKKYQVEFGKALASEKVNRLFKAEKEFHTMVQKEIMERRQGNKNNFPQRRKPVQ